MAKSKGCNRWPASSRCLKKINGINCTSVACAKAVREFLAEKEKVPSQDPNEGRRVLSRYCERYHDLLESESACVRCGSTKITTIYEEDDPGMLEPSTLICVEDPKPEDIRTYCPLNA